ncbi:MAG: hypothetical protein PHP69_03945 [Candidatus Omnitrophica bacterium]|jgi:hypothetical protein|nr:hypothetical protein [Candidatus Omnitrophota bacterium]MDD5441421.1 hypothetical protein [Candidatus Omnitrophota bacterium]
MKKLLLTGLLLSFTLTAFALTPLSIRQNAVTLDGKYVNVYGELIGEPLYEGDGVWLNLVCEGTALAIFVNDLGLLEEVEYWGSYDVKGDIISVSGVFYKHCDIHNDEGLHAEVLDIVKRGYVVDHKVPEYKIKIMIYFFIICLTLVALYFIKGIFIKLKKSVYERSIRQNK